jgi:hypothetical protein
LIEVVTKGIDGEGVEAALVEEAVVGKGSALDRGLRAEDWRVKGYYEVYLLCEF